MWQIRGRGRALLRWAAAVARAERKAAGSTASPGAALNTRGRSGCALDWQRAITVPITGSRKPSSPCNATLPMLLLPSSENRFMRAIRPTPISSIALPSPAVQVSGGGGLRNRHAGESDAADVG